MKNRSISISLVVALCVFLVQSAHSQFFDPPTPAEREAREKAEWERTVRNAASTTEMDGMLNKFLQEAGALTPLDKKKVSDAFSRDRAAYAEANKKFGEALTNIYLTAVYGSVLDPENMEGWPYRFQDIEKHCGTILYNLQSRMENDSNPMLKYAAICPALYSGNVDYADEMEAELRSSAPFLFEQVQNRRKKYWEPYIAKAKSG